MKTLVSHKLGLATLLTLSAFACKRRGADSAPAPDPRQAIQVAIGGSSACAVLADGTVQCWGDNTYGELGDGTREARLVPVAVVGLTGVSKVDVGDAHACARKADGTVWCWGSGSNGALGNGNQINQLTPVQVGPMPPALEVGTSGGNTCAVAQDGGLWCWGSNAFGENGLPPETRAILRPTRITGIGPVAEVDTGQNHTCARLRDGTVWCWGDNGSGQLGDGTSTRRPTPAPVTGLAGALALAVGQNHNCVLLAGGAVSCWGSTGGPSSRQPTAVAVTGATTLTAGNFATCATVGGAPMCFGQNYEGKLLAPRTQRQISAPTALPGLQGVRSVLLGSSYQCAVSDVGPVRCWGSLRRPFGGSTVLRTETIYPVTFDGHSPPPPLVGDAPTAPTGNALAALADAAAQAHAAAQAAVNTAAQAADDAPAPTTRDPLAARATRTTPLTATPHEVTVGERTLRAERCALGGPPLLGDNASGAVTSIAFDRRGALFLVDGESHVRRYLRTRGDDCRFEPDASFGVGGALTLPTSVTQVSVDRSGAAVASGIGGSYVIDDGAVAQRCNAAPHGYVTMSARAGRGLGIFPGSPVRSVAYEDGACEVTPWTYEPPFRSVMAVAFDRRDVIVGGSVANNGGNQLAVYDDRGRERARFGSARPTAEDGFCWIHGVTACDAGYCVVDTNCDRVALWSRRGEHLGNARASTLLGVRRPWLAAIVAGRRELFVAASQVREPVAERVAEGMIFRLTGL
jgi:hypothetical protein